MVKVFKDIVSNKDKWLQSRKGNEFEDRFETSLKKNGYNRLDTEEYKDILNDLKSNILDKTSNEYVKNNYKNTELKQAFFCQPFGSQNYPDFLIFTNNFIIPIEIKYSSKKAVKPMWNSNLPKLNGFYIFGSYNKSDVTFFSGKDVICENERNELINFFEKNIKPLENDFKNKIKKNIKDGQYSFKRGFNVYVRRAFDQNQVCNSKAQIDYFTANDRHEIEKKTIEVLSTLE